MTVKSGRGKPTGRPPSIPWAGRCEDRMGWRWTGAVAAERFEHEEDSTDQQFGTGWAGI